MIHDRTHQTLQVLAEAANQDQKLTDYYEFHRNLLEILHQAKADVRATLKMVDQRALTARVDQGLPLVSFDQLPVNESDFGQLVGTVVELLIDYDPDAWQETPSESIDDSLVLARRRFDENQAGHNGPGDGEMPSVVQMAVDLALKPYLEWAAEQVLEHVDREGWNRPYCPVCGGAPDFAALEAETGRRLLLCSRCNAQWPFARVRCPFCETTDHKKLAYYPGENGVYRLYVCQACRRYLKAIDLRQVERDVVLPAERITTVAMDAAAQSQGYS